MKKNLIEIKNLTKTFSSSKNWLKKEKIETKAVNDVSFEIKKGEILALVGESGSGKSTTARCLLMLEKPTSGDIFFDGIEITNPKCNIQHLRKKMQMVFQNPYGSLNPKMKVKDILKEPLKINKKMSSKEMDAIITETCHLTGIDTDYLDRYPHEFSGGQRQRIGIARAIILKPDFIIADEPVSALDVSIQAQILNLLKDLKEKLNLTYLFISHDLSVVQHIADRVAVMYLGEIVEIATKQELFDNPVHPYTKLLINSTPKIGCSNNFQEKITENNTTNGCSFAPRCVDCKELCKTEKANYKHLSPTHIVKCHFS